MVFKLLFIVVLFVNIIVAEQSRKVFGCKKGDTVSDNEERFRGVPGSSGVQGIQRVQGVQGPVGPSGSSGYPGRNGVKGQKTEQSRKVFGCKKGDTVSDNEERFRGLPGSSGVQGIQRVQGVQGPVGPSGSSGYPGRNGVKGQKGDRGQRGRKGDAAKIDSTVLNKYFPHVAFSVALDHDLEPTDEYRVIKYNIELSNLGQVYDKETGIFVSPENGTFVIGFTGVSYHGQNMLLHLVKNGQRIVSAFDNSGCACCGVDVDLKEKECAGSAGNVAILALSEGERLWIQLPDKYGLHNAPYHYYATFYGYLLHTY